MRKHIHPTALLLAACLNTNAAFGPQPLVFEENRGQTDRDVRYLARGRGYQIFLTPVKTVFALADGRRVEMAVRGADPAPLSAESPTAGHSHYFLGANPITGVPHFQRIVQRSLLPGVDAVFYGIDGKLEFDFHVAAGADPAIQLLFNTDVHVLPGGDLAIAGKSPLRLHKPVAYQNINGQRRPVAARYSAKGTAATIRAGTYDRRYPLIVDPVLSYSTLIGGTSNDIPRAMAVDAAGNAYITGETSSLAFPTQNPRQGVLGGATDVFVTKLNPQGTAIVYSTYLGGLASDAAFGIALDSSGAAYITGKTFSSNFPLQSPLYATGEVFVTKLAPAGNALAYSTRLPLTFPSSSNAIAIDTSGAAYIAGRASGGVPATNAHQPAKNGLADDAFLIKLTPGAAAISYATYFGGSATDGANGVAVDSLGNAWITGVTQSTNFPTLNPRQPTAGGLEDAFAAKFGPSGTLLFSTYLGGDQDDSGNAIAIDGANKAYIAGQTRSDNFPLRNAFQSTRNEHPEGFLTTYNTAGSDYGYSTYLGGGPATALTVNSAGSATIAGYIRPPSFIFFLGFFPINAIQQRHAPGFTDDAYAMQLNAAGAPTFATFLGGSSPDQANAVATGPNGEIYVAGTTESADFPRTPGVIRTSLAGAGDGFISKIDLNGIACQYTISPASATFPTTAAALTYSVTTTSNCPWTTTIPYWSSVTAGATSGIGSGTFTLNLNANPNTTPRISSVQLSAGPSATIYQHGSQGACTIKSITLGQTLTGALTTTGCRSPNRIGETYGTPRLTTGPAYGELYTFQGQAGQRFAIEMSGFDTYVSLLDATGQILGTNDDISDPSNRNSRLPVSGYLRLPYTGTYYIDATSYTSTQTGTYSLGLLTDQVTPPPPPPVTTGLRFVPVTPCRIADTRLATGPFGGPIIAAAQSRDFAIPSSACGIPATALAYSLNITAVPSGVLGFLTAWPAGQSRPLVSTLNSLDGTVVANAAIVPAGASGAISVYVTDSSHVILDINGYFAAPASAPSGLAFYPATPCRISDTRLPAGAFGGPALNGGETRDYTIPAAACGIPASAQAYSLNVTVVPPGPLGYLTAWPKGQNQPFVSTLNSFQGAVVANAAIVPAGSNGTISVFVTDRTDVILDVNGYFAPPGTANALLFYPATPCRVADTRLAPGPFGGPAMVANQVRDFAVPGAACAIPASARAYSLNTTVVPSGPLGYLTTWPAGQAQPFVSTLNSFLGKIVANAALVPAGSNGAISVFVTNPTEVILDINGYFAP